MIVTRCINFDKVHIKDTHWHQRCLRTRNISNAHSTDWLHWFGNKKISQLPVKCWFPAKQR
jgi:hypothetical protein